VIICRTPLRISFFGGGSDYPIWYRQRSGAVISTTINKYNYLTIRKLPPFFDYKYRIRYFKQEYVSSVDQIEHPVVRESIKLLKLNEGLEIAHNGDLPARSGLGSSSSFTVGLLHSLHTLQSYMPTKRELALQAMHVEQDLIGEAVGSQDQTAAAFGGLNRIRFSKAREIDVDPIIVSADRLAALQDRLLLCFTGFARTASEIAARQIEVTHSRKREIEAIQELCEQALELITDPQSSLDEFGKLLDDQWKLKRSLTKLVTSEQIDKIYATGISSGALGGKLLGAGGGGFLLFYAPPDRHEKIKKALGDKMFVPFRFESTGSKIIYYSHD
jgi:D-glycero-alpha-D-manno-heptose-7-phosphate kinase